MEAFQERFGGWKKRGGALFSGWDFLFGGSKALRFLIGNVFNTLINLGNVFLFKFIYIQLYIYLYGLYFGKTLKATSPKNQTKPTTLSAFSFGDSNGLRHH